MPNRKTLLRIFGGIVVLFFSFSLTLLALKVWDARDQSLQTVIQKNSSRVVVPEIIPLNTARVTDGIPLAAVSIDRKDVRSMLQFHIRTYLSSDVFGTGVIAVFLDGQDAPIKIW